MKNILRLCIGIILLTGCATLNSASDLKSLVGSNWQLSTLTGVDDLEEAFKEGLPVLDFQESGRISGTDGCNRLSGEMLLEDIKEGDLDFSRLASTRRACSFNGPDAFQAALRNAKSFQIDEGKLQLLSSSQSVLAEFMPK